MEFNDFTLFNTFLKNKKIYLICSILNFTINEKNLELNLSFNNGKININKFFNRRIEKDSHEPILILIYDIPFNNISNELILSIEYQNKIFVKKLEEEKTDNKKFLTITTLFKDDYNLIPIFYDYYKNNGVDHFYLYYNGKINQNIRDLINKLNALHSNDITLIEWDFKYWNSDYSKYKHNAQLGQMHDAIYRFGKEISEYMIFVDLDEYLMIPNQKTKIRKYLEDNKNITIFGFCNKWSTTIDKKIPNKFPNKFLFGKKHEHGDRSKNIYKIENINTIGIHGYSGSISYNVDNPIKKLDLDMYHFYNWTNLKREFETKNTYSDDYIPKKNISQNKLIHIKSFRKI